MFQGFILQLVKGFVLRQVKKYLSSVKWDLIKSDLVKRAKDIMPGEWFDDEIAAIVANVIDLAEKAAACEACVVKLADAAQLLAEGKEDKASALAKEVVDAIWAEITEQLQSAVKA